MNKEEQRVAIGKALGWETYPSERPSYHGHLIAIDPEGKDAFMPNWPEDLNACAEMENSLDASQWDIYRRNLAKEWATNDDDGMWAAINATAPQRCEAFLRTLNLWTPTPAPTNNPNPDK